MAAEQRNRKVISSLSSMVDMAKKAMGRNNDAHALVDIWDWDEFFKHDLKLPPLVIVNDKTHTAL